MAMICAMTTLGVRIKQAREAAKMSQQDLAVAVGIRQPSIQAIETGRAHGTKHLLAIAKALGQDPEWLESGTGGMRQHTRLQADPGAFETNAGRKVAAPPVNIMPLDVPVYGVAVGGSDGDFSLNGEIVDRVRRPPGLTENRNAFAVFVRGDSMEPRHYQGDLLYVDPMRPARAGDDVLVELKPQRAGEPGAAMIKQLVVKTPLRVVLRQFNPAKELTVPGEKILRVSLILKMADLLGV